jgi:hypothetical protein
MRLIGRTTDRFLIDRRFVRSLTTTLGLCLSLWILPDQAIAKTMLFGGPGHKEYLGCLDCSEFSPDSICNGFGKFGNEFSSSGVFNEFAGFGNEFSSKSPWNEFSNSDEVPVLVDDQGKFFGYFTINKHRHNAVSFASVLYALYKGREGNLEKVRIALCRALGKGS